MSNALGYINGVILSKTKRLGSIPKQVELFDRKLNRISNQWVTGRSFDLNDVVAGVYLIRVQLLSGITEEKVIEVTEGLNSVTLRIELPASTNSTNYRHLTKHLTKSFSRQFDNIEDLYRTPVKLSNIRAIKLKLWISHNNGEGWASDERLKKYVEDLQTDGTTINIHTEPCANVLEIFGNGFPTSFVSLPPDSQLEVTISPSRGERSDLYPLDISVSTDNWKSETLLTLLTQGAIKDAKVLTSVEDAERLLLQKRRDAAAAAVGGYFLLKTGELGRLHDWANNLADWFPWMSDGAIIHAWQMIQDENRQSHILDIKRRLVDAAFGKMPVYTEGFRLLNEGLSQLSYILEHSDQEVEAAYARIKVHLTNIDWSQETTTMRIDRSVKRTLSKGDFLPVFSRDKLK